jgi:NitT/TauT family transport system ATP-binding protein
LKIPLVKAIFDMIVNSEGGTITREECEEFLEEKFPNENSEELFETVINLSMYAELIDYDSRDEEISLISENV